MATTEIYTLSLHDALPISVSMSRSSRMKWTCFPAETAQLSPALDFVRQACCWDSVVAAWSLVFITARSEEHTSELQSQSNLVCRLLLEKKNPVKIAKRFIG